MSPVSFLLVTLALLSSVNLCSASRVVSFNELTPVLPQGTCDSESDCSDGQICVSLDGICSGSECDGLPDSLCSSVIPCSCEEPCGADDVCVEVFSVQGCVNKFIADSLDPFGKPIDCSSVSDEAGEAGSSSSSGNGDEEDIPSEDGSNGHNPADEAICIGVNMLSNFASHELVFKKHALARVLCDAAGSCATKGHIVNYMGRGMMMVKYCSVVGCEERIMKVNSPRYKTGLKVQSKSEGMHFTAFAAHYQTSAEEAVLGGGCSPGTLMFG